MHLLLRIAVGPTELYLDEDETFDDLSDDEKQGYVDAAHSCGLSYVENYISMHEGNGFADWWAEDAGRWADELNETYDPASGFFDPEMESLPDRVVLTGDDALAEAETAWETTMNTIEDNFERAQEKYVEAGHDPAEFFDADPVELRNISMMQHYFSDIFGYGPNPSQYLYIGPPGYRSVTSQDDYEQVREDIEAGGAIVPIDVHY